MLLLLVRLPRPHLHVDGLNNRDDHLTLCLMLLQHAFGKDCHDQVTQASWQPHTSLQGMTDWQCW